MTGDSHHIVMDDGSGDAGNIGPNASSTAIPLKGSAGTHHCTTHPTMVGTINGVAMPAPSPTPGPAPGY